MCRELHEFAKLVLSLLKSSWLLVLISRDMEFAGYINYLIILFEQIGFEVPTIVPEVLEGYNTQLSSIDTP